MRIAIAGRSSDNLPLLMSRVEDARICVSDFTMNLEWCDSRRQKNAQTQERHTLPYTLWPSCTACEPVDCKPQPQEGQRAGRRFLSTCGIYHHPPTRPNRDGASRCTK